MGVLTLAAVVAEVRTALTAIDIDDPALEARMIVEHFTGTTRTDAIARPEMPVADAEATAVRAALQRRLNGEPVHRIFGFRDFHGVRLALSADTLEPRPDTETLVDAAIPFLEETVRRKEHGRFIDLGTGTGAIAIALLKAVDGLTAVATDLAGGALETASRNAAIAGVSERLKLVLSDWFEKIDGRFDAILSNPPYIPSDDIAGLDREVRDFDPRRALDGGADGLDAYRIIARGASARLEPGGFVGVEIGKGQQDDVGRIFVNAGFAARGKFRDLAGTVRVLAFAAGESSTGAFPARNK